VQRQYFIANMWHPAFFFGGMTTGTEFLVAFKGTPSGGRWRQNSDTLVTFPFPLLSFTA
jgi:hypothetical protein